MCKHFETLSEISTHSTQKIKKIKNASSKWTLSFVDVRKSVVAGKCKSVNNNSDTISYDRNNFTMVGWTKIIVEIQCFTLNCYSIGKIKNTKMVNELYQYKNTDGVNIIEAIT